LSLSKRPLNQNSRQETGRAVRHTLCELDRTLHVVVDSVNGRKMRVQQHEGAVTSVVEDDRMGRCRTRSGLLADDLDHRLPVAGRSVYPRRLSAEVTSAPSPLYSRTLRCSPTTCQTHEPAGCDSLSSALRPNVAPLSGNRNPRSSLRHDRGPAKPNPFSACFYTTKTLSGHRRGIATGGLSLAAIGGATTRWNRSHSEMSVSPLSASATPVRAPTRRPIPNPGCSNS
jgi:hypothetical protein